MPKIEDLLVSYGSYHRNPANRRTHFIGVPLVFFGLLLLLNLLLGSFVPELSPAAWFVVILWAGYLILAPRLALVLLLPLVFLGVIANVISAVGMGFFFFVLSSAVGWYFQLQGHKAEGNRPALMTNVWQVLVAPLFLAAEFLFSRGWKPDLAKRVHGI